MFPGGFLVLPGGLAGPVASSEPPDGVPLEPVAPRPLDVSLPAGGLAAGVPVPVVAVPARVAVPRGLEGMPAQLSQPEYATVVGLLLYGARARRQAPLKPATFVGKIISMFAGA